ncbi:MAG: hypothetical protein BM564_03845 [Bacteroidetes bacterium MedPE-SWsnd-G2]|nr:MAG: hypothetical protein BM564_03845 [Bacteroidetes bacterium MedPE-SWsnd-G2]
MKKTTQKLSSQLAKYGALSLAMAGAADASGQIEYTDITPDEGGDITYLLDLDNNGIDDYNIANVSGNLLLNFYFTPAAGSNSFINTMPSAAGMGSYPTGLDMGDVISSSNGDWTYGNFYNWMGTWDNINGCTRANAEFCGAVGDKYLGLKFDIDGATHYGWARIGAINGSTTNWVIKDYAYNTTADEAINAGQTTLSINDNELANSVEVIAVDKTITVNNLDNAVNYNVYSLTGQVLQSGKLESGANSINMNTVASGIYVIELTDTETQAKFAKKVIL